MTDTNESDGGRSDEPFGDLLDEIEGNRRTEDGTSSGDGTVDGLPVDEETIFTEESYDSVDTDELWAELGAESRQVDSTQSVGGVRDETDTDVVPKRTFCQSCRFVTEPPEFRCTHEGTEIVEFDDTEHVRVRNCPIVEERRAESEETF